MGKYLSRWIKAGGCVLLIAALVLIPGSRPARAHAVIPDGIPADWCYPALLPVGTPDSRSTILPPACPPGNEVLWEDGVGDLVVGSNDIATFATTGDPSNVYFIVGLGGPMTGGEHIQIAIDLAPGGNNTWYNPVAAPLGLVGAAVPGGPIAADYLITSDITGGSTAPGWLWEATTGPPGTWTAVGPLASIAFGAMDIEVGVPWGMFGPSVPCPTCPPFGPGSTANITLLLAMDNANVPAGCNGLISGAPCSVFPEDDLLSELVGGTWTTTPNNCLTGPGPPPSTVCELGDGSADAFIRVTYLAPTAIGVQEATASGTHNWLVPALVALPVAGLTARLLLRRRRSYTQE